MKKKFTYKIVLASVLTAMLFSLYALAEGYLEPFTDVPKKEWYAGSVEYVYENGLMNGVTETTFEPETHVTRGMIVTIIYRLENSPEVDGELQFSDVNKTYYYAEPIVWASENKIVNGYDEDTFAPEDKITREQFATILYRYADYKGYDVSYDENVAERLEKYADSALISDYARDTMSWANDSELITGVTTETLEPQGIATRAQAATIFMRFNKILEKMEEDAVSDEENDVEKPVEPEKDEDEDEDDKPNKPPKKENSTLDKDDNDEDEDKNNGNDGNKNDDDKNNNQDNDENAGEWDDVKDNQIEEDEITSATIYVDSAVAEEEYVTVVISVKNNPGIASLKFDVEYDDESLKLVSLDFDSQWGDYITAPTPYKNPQAVNLISPFKNITKNGRLATLRFQILDVSYSKKITIKCDKNNIFNSNFNEVKFDVINGTIKNKE